MGNKFYKISAFEKFFKFVKKDNKFVEYKSFHINDCSFGLLEKYDTREEAERAIVKKTEEHPFNTNVSYEKIGDTTYVLRYKDSTKTYRIVSFCICEFEDLEI